MIEFVLQAVNDPTVSDIATSLCIYLLDMAMRFPVTENLSGKVRTRTYDLKYLDIIIVH